MHRGQTFFTFSAFSMSLFIGCTCGSIDYAMLGITNSSGWIRQKLDQNQKELLGLRLHRANVDAVLADKSTMCRGMRETGVVVSIAVLEM